MQRNQPRYLGCDEAWREMLFGFATGDDYTLNIMVDDAELLRRYAENRSEEAFAEFVQRHLNLVYAAALRRLSGDSHRAAEVAQTVFTAAARDAARLSRHVVLTGWLYSATRNAAIDVIRVERRRQQREQESLLRHEMNTSSETDWEQMRPVLDEAMDELDSRDRDAVLLRYFQGTSFGEIGRKLSLTEDAARMRVTRAIERLRALLARRGVTSTSAALSSVLVEQASTAAPAGLSATITGQAFSTLVAEGVGVATSNVAAHFTGAKAAIGFGIAAAAIVIGVVVSRESARTDSTPSLAAPAAQNFVIAPTPNETRSDPAPASIAKVSTPSVPALDPAEFTRELQFRLHSDPEMLRLNREEYRTIARFGYASLHAALGMTAEQIEQFETLLIEKAKVGVDLAAVRYLQGWEETDPEFLAFKTVAVERRVHPLDAQLRALLGDAGYRQFQQIKPVGGVRTLLDALTAAGEQPDAASALSLPKALTSTIAKPTDPAASPPEWSDLNWDEVLAQAQGVMSERQLAVLHALRGQALRQQEIYRRREQIIQSVLSEQTRAR
jgi:RNA polymerase sigma factor (sigma-70 family)